MKNLYCTILLFALLWSKAAAQISLFGQVDSADIKLTNCDFERGANAMVLFDNAEVRYKFATIIMERHKRVKILNERGHDNANVRIVYYGTNKDELLTITDAQTINYVNGKIEITPLDKKLIYDEKIDKNRTAKVFAFPNVKAGSIIEYKYKLETSYPYNYPDWAFQADIPTRYSKFTANFIDDFRFSIFNNTNREFAIDSTIKRNKGKCLIWAMENVPAAGEEAFTYSEEDSYQHINFRPSHRNSTWADVGRMLLDDSDYGEQLNRDLDKEEEVIKKVNTISSADEKIAYLFNMVKTSMNWNKHYRWYTEDGTKKAWAKKTGNSAEINLILYHFLKICGLSPTLITYSPRGQAQLLPDYPEYTNLNHTAVAIGLNTPQNYILDASGKYNVYNKVPLSVQGVYVLTVDPEAKQFGFVRLGSNETSRQVVFVNANIGGDATLKGTIQIINSNYDKASALAWYDKNGEKKYLEKLKNDDNNIHISAYKMKGMAIDSLPLQEDMDFTAELPESDNNYIYFRPNLFTGIGSNPFVKEARQADIDFIYLNNYTINGNYKIPAGYKVDVLPDALMFVMPDKSISFKRSIGEVDGAIIVHYVIDLKRTFYEKDEYPELHQFYKKMYEMLNEPIVLKKS